MSDKYWDTYTTIESLSEAQLEQLNKDYFPKLIMSAAKGHFKNAAYLTDKSNHKLVTATGTSLSKEEISNFSEFTIDTFYKVHTRYYPSTEIDIFKEHQNIFFSLQYRYIRHELNDQIVGYLTAALLEEHPFFKEPSWHIGYWGMTSTIKDKELRSAIKNDWGNLLTQLNKTARISGNIDYFNKPAISMASGYGMQLDGFRMDPR